MKLMKHFIYFLTCTFSLIMLMSRNVFATPVDIQFWHAMSGPLGQEVDKLVTQFNESQSKYHITPVYKGNYSQAFTAMIAAFRAHTQPTIAQVFEIGTGTLMHAGTSVYYPVNELMKSHDYSFNTNDFIPAVASYYVNSKNELVSYPFNSSTAVMFYNKAAMKKAGLDPNKPPKTWSELAKDSKVIMKKAGFPHGFSVGWSAWVLFENTALVNGQLYATNNNGYQPGTPRLLMNSPFFLKHLNNMEQWKNDGVFAYGGRYSQAVPLFSTQQVSFYLDSSSDLSTIEKVAKFNFGVAPLPYYSKVKGAPHNTIVGGASLWVLRGHSDDQYKAAAAFFHYLSEPSVQAEWVKATGYVPTLHTTWNYLKQEGYYKTHPFAEVALNELSRENLTPNNRGIRLQNMSQIRDSVNSYLEQIWSNHMTPKQALAELVSKNNALLKQSY